MITVMDTLFPAKLTGQRRTPLIDAATELFIEHWLGAAMDEILIPAQNSLELVNRVCTEWQTKMRKAYASATHASKMQAHVAALEEHLENPTEEQPAGGPSGGSYSSTGPPGGVANGAAVTISDSTFNA